MKENARTTSMFAYLRILDNLFQIRLESASEIMVVTELLKIMSEHWPAWNGAFRQRLDMCDDAGKFGGLLRNLSTELKAQGSSTVGLILTMGRAPATSRLTAYAVDVSESDSSLMIYRSLHTLTKRKRVSLFPRLNLSQSGDKPPDSNNRSGKGNDAHFPSLSSSSSYGGQGPAPSRGSSRGRGSFTTSSRDNMNEPYPRFVRCKSYEAAWQRLLAAERNGDEKRPGQYLRERLRSKMPGSSFSDNLVIEIMWGLACGKDAFAIESLNNMKNFSDRNYIIKEISSLEAYSANLDECRI